MKCNSQIRKNFHYLEYLLKNNNTFKFNEQMNLDKIEPLKSLSRFM